jgi:hypothetical protein
MLSILAEHNKLDAELVAEIRKQLANAEKAIADVRKILRNPTVEEGGPSVHRQLKRAFGRVQGAGERGAAKFSKYS